MEIKSSLEVVEMDSIKRSLKMVIEKKSNNPVWTHTTYRQVTAEEKVFEWRSSEQNGTTEDILVRSYW